MQIAKHKVVTIDYTLKDDTGREIDSSREGNFAYLHGANNIIPGLEDALSGKSRGDEVDVSVAPEEGYGARDEAMSSAVPREMFPKDVEVLPGMQFQAEGPEGQMLLLTVTNVAGDEITVDGNHPLAGVQLNFQVRVVDVRDATQEEIQHGHVHGPGGHQHQG
jgi:FKBP-type peptidyl-prolyl cis-trans isomerase SlyD